MVVESASTVCTLVVRWTLLRGCLAGASSSGRWLLGWHLHDASHCPGTPLCAFPLTVPNFRCLTIGKYFSSSGMHMSTVSDGLDGQLSVLRDSGLNFVHLPSSLCPSELVLCLHLPWPSSLSHFELWQFPKGCGQGSDFRLHRDGLFNFLFYS